MDELRGRTVVITGGGSGIGRGSALAFAAAGAHVVVADVDGARAEAVAAEVRSAGGRGLGLACDVTRDADFEALRDATLAELGRVDIVMNNVGVIAAGLPLAIPLEEWQRVLDTNLLSLVRSNAVFLPLLLEQGEGHLVNTASTAALYPYAYDRLPYAASKAGVIAVSECLALYLRPRGVGVTVLCPGPVATNIVEQMAFHGELGPVRAPELAILDPLDVGEMVVRAVRDEQFLLLTHPDEVREVLRRKGEDPDAFMTGQVNWVIDNGG